MSNILKIHSKMINDAFNHNMYAKYFIDHPNIPIELKSAMQNIGATQSILIRLDESLGSSVFVLFFDSTIDLLDYRISFCQMFLRQSDIFYQYQFNVEKLNQLQLFLRQVLDHLPTGILITNASFKLTYVNSKMMQYIENKDFKLRDDIRSLNLPDSLIDAMDHVYQSGSDYAQKQELTFQGKAALYFVSSFKLFNEKDEHVILVLTNIQQSKELIDQMNQTNRLAMMSKIAKGISYELGKPVHQLIQGVEKIQYEWHDPSFQDFFSTDIIPQVDRINLLCQSLLRLSRSNTESLVEVFLPDLLDQVLRLIAGDLRYTTQKFYVGVLDRVWIIVDQVMAIQVLMNLMIFCLKSLAKESSRLSLDILLEERHLLSIKIQISDYLAGGFTNAENIKDQLELSIVNQIVMNQNGQFDIFCEHDLAWFNVRLPVKKIAVPTVT